MKRMYVAERWDECARTFPNTIDANKKAWLRVAFYAGAGSMLDLLQGLFSSGDGEPTEEDIGKVISIQQELQDFLVEMRKKSRPVQ